jgi:hypothetical protein
VVFCEKTMKSTFYILEINRFFIFTVFWPLCFILTNKTKQNDNSTSSLLPLLSRSDNWVMWWEKCLLHYFFYFFAIFIVLEQQNNTIITSLSFHHFMIILSSLRDERNKTKMLCFLKKTPKSWKLHIQSDTTKVTL